MNRLSVASVPPQMGQVMASETGCGLLQPAQVGPTTCHWYDSGGSFLHTKF